MQCVVIDSPSPVCVTVGEVTNYPDRDNKQGEADYAMWFHASWSPCCEILVCANDTDVYIYGFGIMECGWLLSKKVCVERMVQGRICRYHWSKMYLF